jgi:hypothetical protein
MRHDSAFPHFTIMNNHAARVGPGRRLQSLPGPWLAHTEPSPARPAAYVACDGCLASSDRLLPEGGGYGSGDAGSFALLRRLRTGTRFKQEQPG